MQENRPVVQPTPQPRFKAEVRVEPPAPPPRFKAEVRVEPRQQQEPANLNKGKSGGFVPDSSDNKRKGREGGFKRD